MRIITGKFKGRNLHLVPGLSTRPTTAFNREVIFSVYQDYDGCRVLDLFAGTGSLGLETLSRGAKWVDFVEFAPAALATILKNIELLGCGESCHLWRKRADAYLKSCTESYDIIFLDPPYRKNLVNPTLELIKARELLSPGGIIMVEHDPREKLLPEFRAWLTREKSSKSSQFSWLSFDIADQENGEI